MQCHRNTCYFYRTALPLWINRSHKQKNFIKTFQSHFNCNSTLSESTDNMNLKTVVSKLNKFAPTSLAEKWDNVGLLVEPSAPHTVSRILLTNDLTEPVLEEAVQKEANLIISYHPPIFMPLKSLTQRTWKERIVVRCIENRIAVFSPHTSYDALAGGINDWLISAFGNGKVEPIHSVTSPNFPTCKGYRVQITGVKSTISQAHQQISTIDGANVSPCSQYIRDSESSSPDLLTQLSINCSEKALSKVVALLNTFPDLYQATEITQLAKPPIPDHGSGRLLRLQNPLSESEAVARVKTHLNLEHVRLAKTTAAKGDPLIKKVAVCAGSGGTVLKGVEADLYVTGEMSHHEVLEAVSKGTSVILCDHSNTERGFLHILQTKLTELFESQERQAQHCLTKLLPLHKASLVIYKIHRMPGRRYLCEFCDKAFADNMSSRRNHLRSVHHQRMRKQHYDAFRDPATILAEEMAKPTCKRFFRTGSCDFGSGCCFSHLTPERKQELENLILREKEKKRKASKLDENSPSLEEWLAKRKKKQNRTSEGATEEHKEQQQLPVYSMPQCLLGMQEIPVSLLPPPPEAFKPGVNCEWWG